MKFEAVHLLHRYNRHTAEKFCDASEEQNYFKNLNELYRTFKYMKQ
jgi:hypothetical protein